MNRLVRIFARTCGNFGVTFFGSLVAFELIIDVDPWQVVYGAALTAGILSGLSISYEVKKYGEGQKQ